MLAIVDAPLGLEPRSARSKHAVLPLDDGALAKVAGLEPAITVLETAALAAKLHRRGGPCRNRTHINALQRRGSTIELKGRWSGWKVSNLRSPESKSGALPTKPHPETVQPNERPHRQRRVGRGRCWVVVRDMPPCNGNPSCWQ